MFYILERLFKIIALSSQPYPVVINGKLRREKMSEQKSKIFIAIIMGIVSVLLISAVSITFPARAVIPLNIDFKVGEKMVYDTTQTTIYASEENSSQSTIPNVDSTKETIEVMDFDGQSYTLNHTVQDLNQTIRTAFTETLSKTGNSTWHVKIGDNTANASGPSYTFVPNVLELLTEKPQARVADSWRIPYESSSAEASGNLIITFYGFENLTVPAGTYNVFKVGVKSDNVNVHYTVSRNGFEANVGEGFNIQIYFEYGSLRQIKYDAQGSISVEPSLDSQSFLNMMPKYTHEEMVLIEDMKS